MFKYYGLTVYSVEDVVATTGTGNRNKSHTGVRFDCRATFLMSTDLGLHAT
jgi:hypothetical protein